MYLVTGVAGFIGYHTAMALLHDGLAVLGVDHLENHHFTQPKQERLDALLRTAGDFTFIKANINSPLFEPLIEPYLSRITHVIHLAAMANARHSLRQPREFVENNIGGQQAILELCRCLPVLRHFIYASSSSVYGNTNDMRLREDCLTDNPLSIYAASKKAAEILTKAYALAYQIPATGLRLFSVYGPWSRSDMACYSFTDKILRGEPIELFNDGKMHRDFTYIEDIVSGIMAAANSPPNGTSFHKIYNLGSGQQKSLEELVGGLEEALEMKAVRQYGPLPRGEMIDTCADITAASRDLNYHPKMDFKTGLKHFVRWYREFHNG